MAVIAKLLNKEIELVKKSIRKIEVDRISRIGLINDADRELRALRHDLDELEAARKLYREI